MALIVKSSIDILPWTEMEKQKLIEDKKEFLNKDENKAKAVEEKQKEDEKATKNSAQSTKSTDKKKEDKKKEVDE